MTLGVGGAVLLGAGESKALKTQFDREKKELTAKNDKAFTLRSDNTYLLKTASSGVSEGTLETVVGITSNNYIRKEDASHFRIPSGGTTGQVLAKVDGTDYNIGWATPSGGGGTQLYRHSVALVIASEPSNLRVEIISTNPNPYSSSNTDLELVTFSTNIYYDDPGGMSYVYMPTNASVVVSNLRVYHIKSIDATGAITKDYKSFDLTSNDFSDTVTAL